MRLRKKAIPEVLEWIINIQIEDVVDLEAELPISIMISLFYRIVSIIEINGDEDNPNEASLRTHVMGNLVYEDDSKYLLIPVFLEFF